MSPSGGTPLVVPGAGWPDKLPTGNIASVKIVVCVKHVPDASGDREFADDLTLDREAADGLLQALSQGRRWLWIGVVGLLVASIGAAGLIAAGAVVAPTYWTDRVATWDDLGAEQPHPCDVQRLPFGVDLTHVHGAVEAEQRRRWQLVNLGAPLALLGLFGAVRAWRRKRRYTRFGGA